MTRIFFVLKELGRNFIRHPLTAVSSLLSMTLLILLFDLFWVMVGTSERFYTNLLSELRMDVFVSEELPDSAIADLTASIEAVKGVATVDYIDKEAAREELASEVGMDLLVGYDTLNPLPRSYSLTFDEAYLNLVSIIDIAGKMQAMPGVFEVNYSRAWLEKVEGTKSIILRLGLALGLVIFLSAFIGSFNSIRLVSQARGGGFKQMLLLGSSKTFISLPFVLEGFIIGGLSAVLSWWLIFYGNSRVTFTQLEIVIPPMNDIIYFSVAVAVLGAFSAYLGVWKSLR